MNRPYSMEYARKAHAKAQRLYLDIVERRVRPSDVVGKGYAGDTYKVATEYARDMANTWAKYLSADPDREHGDAIVPCADCSEYVLVPSDSIPAVCLCEECR